MFEQRSVPTPKKSLFRIVRIAKNCCLKRTCSFRVHVCSVGGKTTDRMLRESIPGMPMVLVQLACHWNKHILLLCSFYLRIITCSVRELILAAEQVVRHGIPSGSTNIIKRAALTDCMPGSNVCQFRHHFKNLTN